MTTRARPSMWIAAAALCVLALGACSSTTDDPDQGRSQTSSGGTDTAPDTSPLTIGITFLDNAASARALGADPPTLTNEMLVKAYVRSINDAGGLGGRQVTAVTYGFNASDANYGTAAAAACAKFTQDNHVSVVLDNAFGTIGGFGSCLQDAGVFVVTAQSEGDLTASSEHTLHANTLSPTIDRVYSAVLQRSASEGYLDADNQLGIVIEDCPANQAAYTNTIKPLISQLGLTSPKTVEVACTTGFDSATAAASALQSAVLAFSDAGVDRVMFLSDYEYIMLMFFAPVADAQHYTPGYLLSSQAQPVLTLPAIPKGQWPQLHGVGWQPYGDVNNPEPTEADSKCLDMASAGGAAVSSQEDQSLAISSCGPYLLLDTLLTATKGHDDPDGLASALGDLGTTFAGPGLVEASTDFSSKVLDGPAMTRPFAFQASCDCLEYTGPAEQLP